MTSDRFQPWRWFVKVLQALLVLSIPFLKIGGESALRFDVPSLTLFFFGARISMDEFFLVLVVLLFLGFLLVLLTILFGRIWCGWLCPQTVVIDFTRFVDRPAAGSGTARILAFGALLPISSVLAASLLWYFVSPYEFVSRLLANDLGAVLGGSWAVLTTITFLNFAFLRHRFCRTVCPYAKMQGALYDDRTLIIGPDPDRMAACMHCDACVRVCPVGIDVREGLDAACINCAECIDACGRQMGRRGMRSLIGYRFGIGLAGRGSIRWGVVLSAVTTAVFLVLLFFLTTSQTPIDASIMANSATPPRTDAGGRVVNSYILSLTNRTDKDMQLQLEILQKDGHLDMEPKQLTLPGNAHIRKTIEVLGDRQSESSSVRIFIRTERHPIDEIVLEATFLPPW